MTTATMIALAALPGLAAPIAIGGVAAPEDLDAFAGTPLVVVSQVHAPDGTGAGMLALLDPATDRLRPLPIRFAPAPGWGDPGCAPPARIGPHGIHVSRRRDGRLQLLVVNHQARESIELLELDPGTGGALWRGCVRSDEAFNDVVATPEGGFVATVPTARGSEDRTDGRIGGFLSEWRPGRGLRRLPGSDAAFNNGVQISRDGRAILFAAWATRELVRYDRRSARITRRVTLGFLPDNLAVTPSGRLLATGMDQRPTPAMLKVDGQPAPPFTVALVDPRTLRATTLYHGAAGTIAGASVALRIGRTLYIGGYAGARLLKLTWPGR